MTIKYTPQFSCWRISSALFYIIASVPVSADVVVFAATPDGQVTAVELAEPLKDVRLYYPCKWVALPAILRARVRSALHRELERRHPESFEPVYGALPDLVACD